MIITRLGARDFLSLADVDVEFGGAVTTVTGPNGVGKSNLGRIIDVTRCVLNQGSGRFAPARAELYSRAGRNGAGVFSVTVGVHFDQPHEQELLVDYWQAAFALNDARDGREHMAQLERIACAKITAQSMEPLFTGQVTIAYNSARDGVWWAAYSFQTPSGDPASDSFVRRTVTIPLISSTGTADMVCVADVPPFSVRQGEGLGAASFLLGLDQTMPGTQLVTAAEIVPTIDLTAAVEQTAVRRRPMLFHLSISPLNASSGPIPASLERIARHLDVTDVRNRAWSFGEVFGRLFDDGVVVTDNRRLPPRRTFSLAELAGQVDLADGANIAAVLFVLKNGTAADRAVYDDVRRRMRQLIGKDVDLHVTVASGQDTLTLDPVVVTDGRETPLEFAGAGVNEALVLATLISHATGRFLVLDEPAVNLEPTVQRALTSTLRRTSRSLVITHSPHLLQVTDTDDLASIVRLTPTENGPSIRRAPTDLDALHVGRWLQLLTPSDVRALLFAAAVVLCEGQTEVGALPVWWADTSDLHDEHGRPLPNPETAHITIISVNGDGQFGIYVSFLEAFGIPWAIVADGPALTPRSDLAKYLTNHRLCPSDRPDNEEFTDWQAYWKQAGVFTVADQFGTDGNKGGEFEAYLQRLDAPLLEKANTLMKTKPRQAAYFAANIERPAEISTLYQAITHHLGNQGRTPAHTHNADSQPGIGAMTSLLRTVRTPPRSVLNRNQPTELRRRSRCLFLADGRLVHRLLAHRSIGHQRSGQGH